MGTDRKRADRSVMAIGDERVGNSVDLLVKTFGIGVFSGVREPLLNLATEGKLVTGSLAAYLETVALYYKDSPKVAEALIRTLGVVDLVESQEFIKGRIDGMRTAIRLPRFVTAVDRFRDVDPEILSDVICEAICFRIAAVPIEGNEKERQFSHTAFDIYIHILSGEIGYELERLLLTPEAKKRGVADLLGSGINYALAEEDSEIAKKAVALVADLLKNGTPSLVSFLVDDVDDVMKLIARDLRETRESLGLCRT